MSDTNIDRLVTEAIDLVNKGSISLSQVLKALTPPAEKLPVPTKVPLPAVITDKQKAALDKLPEVFGKVVPTERRALQPVEVKALWEERQVLDEIGKLAESRKAAIRTSIFNHFDVTYEAEFHGSSGMDGLIESADFDKDGHYVREAQVPIPETDMVFRREVTEGQPSVSARALEEAMLSGEITRKQYLSMTTATRVVDESKIMATLKKEPKLIHTLAKIASPGRKTAAFWPRKAKP